MTIPDLSRAVVAELLELFAVGSPIRLCREELLPFTMGSDDGIVAMLRALKAKDDEIDLLRCRLVELSKHVPEPGPRPDREHDAGSRMSKKELRPAKVLVLFAHGKAMALCCGPNRSDADLGDVFDLPENGFALDGMSAGTEPVAYEAFPDGLYVGKIHVEDDGPGDCPGSREVALVLCDVRKATKEEWESHCIGEWPWE